MKLDHCSAEECAAPIVWTRTERGKNMPVDADPVEVKAGFRLVEGEGAPLARYTRAPEPGERLYVAHWFTCPAAERFRK